MNYEPSNVNVSIITVCYNAAKELPMTIESVLAQDYDDFEYIIKDGASGDDSLRILDSYRERFSERGITYKVISEADGGIYDAMNKGVLVAEGTWINFMNAGDCFYSSTVLSQIFSDKSYPTSAILYGDCAEYEYGRFYLFPKNMEGIRSVMPFSHQATFANRSLLLRLPFKCEYRYSADYDFLLSAYDRELHFTDVGCVVCITNKDGVSSVNYHDMLNESADILKNHGVAPMSGSQAAGRERSLKIKQFILDHFPDFIKKFIRGVQIKLRHQNFDYVIPPWYKINE